MKALQQQYADLVKEGIMSAELAGMLCRKRSGPQMPTSQFGWAIDTVPQRKLCSAANRILRKAKFFAHHDKFEGLPAECIAGQGLRPMWHGTV